jgi:hypothetical protein
VKWISHSTSDARFWVRVLTDPPYFLVQFLVQLILTIKKMKYNKEKWVAKKTSDMNLWFEYIARPLKFINKLSFKNFKIVN